MRLAPMLNETSPTTAPAAMMRPARRTSVKRVNVSMPRKTRVSGSG